MSPLVASGFCKRAGSLAISIQQIFARSLLVLVCHACAILYPHASSLIFFCSIICLRRGVRKTSLFFDSRGNISSSFGAQTHVQAIRCVPGGPLFISLYLYTYHREAHLITHNVSVLVGLAWFICKEKPSSTLRGNQYYLEEEPLDFFLMSISHHILLFWWDLSLFQGTMSQVSRFGFERQLLQFLRSDLVCT